MTTANGLSSIKTGSHAKGPGHQLAREGLGVVTLAAGLTLTLAYRNHLKLDPGGAARTVVLPAVSGADGAFFEIYNAASAAGENITVTDATPTTLEVLGQDESAVFRCDGVTWYSMGVVPSSAARVRVARVEITTAQLLAMHTTPITLVAAPGAGKYLEFISATMLLDFESAAYAAIATTDDIEIRYTDGSGAEVASQEATGFLDATADEIRCCKAGAAAIATPFDVQPVANAVLCAYLSGAITTGDSPLIVETLYRVRTSAP